MHIIQNNNYFFDVLVDGVRKVHIQNNNPRKFDNVKVSTGIVYVGQNVVHESANAEIRNFVACQLSSSR